MVSEGHERLLQKVQPKRDSRHTMGSGFSRVLPIIICLLI